MGALCGNSANELILLKNISKSLKFFSLFTENRNQNIFNQRIPPGFNFSDLALICFYQQIHKNFSYFLLYQIIQILLIKSLLLKSLILNIAAEAKKEKDRKEKAKKLFRQGVANKIQEAKEKLWEEGRKKMKDVPDQLVNMDTELISKDKWVTWSKGADENLPCPRGIFLPYSHDALKTMAYEAISKIRLEKVQWNDQQTQVPSCTFVFTGDNDDLKYCPPVGSYKDEPTTEMVLPADEEIVWIQFQVLHIMFMSTPAQLDIGTIKLRKGDPRKQNDVTWNSVKGKGQGPGIVGIEDGQQIKQSLYFDNWFTAKERIIGAAVQVQENRTFWVEFIIFNMEGYESLENSKARIEAQAPEEVKDQDPVEPENEAPEIVANQQAQE